MSSGPSIPGVDAFDLGRDLHYDGVHNRVYNSVGMFFDVGANQFGDFAGKCRTSGGSLIDDRA